MAARRLTTRAARASGGGATVPAPSIDAVARRAATGGYRPAQSAAASTGWFWPPR